MKRKTIRWIISLAVLLLVWLITTQVIWLGKAYNVIEQQFNNDVSRALKDVALQILQHSNGEVSSAGYAVEQLSSNFFRVSLNDTLHPYYLESLLNHELKKWGIDTDFEYSIYDCFTDSVVFKKFVSDNELKTEISPQIDWEEDGHYFGIYFPSKKGHILGQMKFWLFSSVLLLVVMMFFAYTISIILKQKRLSEITTDFINNMTHELKTPISTISLSSEVLMKKGIENQPERLRKYAGIIFQENNRLKEQVERVLQVAYLEKDNYSLKKKSLNVHDLIGAVANNMKAGVTACGGKIVQKLDAGDPVIIADEVHVTNIINNLVDNACKYARESPRVEIFTRNRYEGIVIGVEDNGVGIDPEHQKYVFDKFYRVPTGNVHDIKGFGLGLYYVRLMVNAHGGKIVVTSKPGKGSCFEIFLPKKLKNEQ